MQQPFKEEAVFQFLPKCLAHRKTSDVKREPTLPLCHLRANYPGTYKKPPDVLQLKRFI